MENIDLLENKGVIFPYGKQNIFVGEDVDPDRIEEGAKIFPGSVIVGNKTLIQRETQIGTKGPCHVKDMVIGQGAKLGSGSFEDSVLLDRVKLGTSVRVRENCLLEENCEASFSVDLKLSFLLANTVLGSEINFCDLLMAGGTSRKDHSEVGSGVIHFNFTPFGASGDKVTASLFGDVVHGVFYRSKRIFIGGHSSLVGPIKIGYGTVVAAGSRVVSSIGENQLAFGGRQNLKDIEDFDFNCYRSIRKKVLVSVEFIAQLGALWHWYKKVRLPAASHPLEKETVIAALEVIQNAIQSRMDRFDKFHSYMPKSSELNLKKGEKELAAQHRAFADNWPKFRERLLNYHTFDGDPKIVADRDSFQRDFYGWVTEGVDDKSIKLGIVWLQSIINHLIQGSDDLLNP